MKLDLYKFTSILDPFPEMNQCWVWNIAEDKHHIECVKCKKTATHCIGYKQVNDKKQKMYYSVARKWYDKHGFSHLLLFTVDHILSKSLGGWRNQPSNLQIMCSSCNQAKKANIYALEMVRIIRNVKDHLAPNRAKPFFDYVEQKYPYYENWIRSLTRGYAGNSC